MNCARRGLACDNGLRLKWEEEFVAHGRAFGRQGVWSKEHPRRSRQASSPGSELGTTCLYLPKTIPTEAHHFINIFVRHLENNMADQNEDDLDESTSVGRKSCSVAGSPGSDSQLTTYCHDSMSPSSSYEYPTATSPASLSPFTCLDNFNPSLLEYYFLRLCPLTMSSHLITSPFVDLILPLFAAGGQEFVLQSIMAFSARHRSLTDSSWSRVALSLKGRALCALRQRLGLLDITADAIADPQVPVAMMFLCLDEILDNCDHRWVIHLRACQGWLRRRKQLLSSCPPSSLLGLHSEDSLVIFAERFFAFQDVISRTACGNSPQFGLEYWQSPTQLSNVQGWIGCSPTLARIIFQITELGRTRGHKQPCSDAFEKQARSLEEELKSLSYRSPQVQAVKESGSSTLTVDSEIDSSSELMREAAKLYHHCLLHDASPSTPLVVETVSRILQSIHEHVQAGCTSGMAFPLFVAAVELDPLSDELVFRSENNCLVRERVSGRRLVLEILEALSGFALFNIAKTRAVIRNIWAMRDLSLDEDRGISARAENDWNVYVSPYCSNISLA